MSLAFVFSLIYFSICVVYILFALYVVFLDMRSKINRLFFTLCLLLGIWTFSYAIANSAPDQETALIWMRVAVFGWGMMAALFLHCVLAMTGKEQFLKNKWLYVLLYLPGAVTVFVFGISGGLAAEQYQLINSGAGWVNIADHGAWLRFYYIYAISFSLAAIYLLWGWQKRTEETTKKKLSRWLIISIFVMIFSLATNNVLGYSGQLSKLYYLAENSVLLPVAVMLYAIRKYRFIDPTKESIEHKPSLLKDADLPFLYQVISVAFFLGSVLHFAVAYFFYHYSLKSVLPFSIFLFVYCIIFQLVRRFPPRAKIQETLFILLVNLSIPVITLKFIHMASITVWMIPILFLILSVVYKPVMLKWVGLMILLTQLLVYLLAPAVTVHVNAGTYFTRFGLSAIAIWLVYYVNRLYQQRLAINEAQIEFQKLISQVSQEFVKAAEHNMDDLINEMLAASGRYFRADRAWFKMLSPLQVWEWCAEGISPAREYLLSINSDDYPWIIDTLKHADMVYLPDTEALGPEHETEKSLLYQRSNKSFLGIKVAAKNELLGYLCFTTLSKHVSWREDHREMLKILANVLTDMLGKIDSEKEISYMAYYDSLTGLPNRQTFKNTLNKRIDTARLGGKILAVMFIDLDYFKSINDTMGHNKGDEVLKLLSARLASVIRPTDCIARFGGDEFLILLNNLESKEDIAAIADRIMETFAAPLHIQEQELFITGSAGIAVYPTDGEDAEELIKNADLAMYVSKDNGKNQYTFCTRAMKTDVQKNATLTYHLHHALERNELQLFYQPQINVANGMITGAESLLRWNHPELGVIHSKVFIGLAEQTGLIRPIGQWVMETACRQNKRWHDMGIPLRMAVNLSLEQFCSPMLVKLVDQTLKMTGLDPGYLELELTESIAVKEAVYIISILNNLKKLGIMIALDDFGTEYSSLTRLKYLPADRIKIDMQFIHGIAEGNKDEAIAKTIIQLAKNLNMKVLAEGVETEVQYEFCRRHNCDEIQGFYFHRPMPAEELESLLLKDCQRSII